MKTFITQNWFKLGILLVLLLAVLAFVFYRQSTKTSGVESSAAKTSYAEGTSEIKQFISDLPNGDVEPQKCKELISDFGDSFFQLGGTSTGQPFPSDSKYIYSKKLCLVQTQFYNSQKQLTDQILDLGSNEIFGERVIGGTGSGYERLSLFGKEQKMSQNLFFDAVWLAVKEQI